MQLHHEMEQMKIVIKQLHIDNATKDVVLQETKLSNKVAELEMVNAKIELRVDSLDENIQRNTSASEKLRGTVDKMGSDMKKLQTSAVGLSGQMGYHREKLHELVQFIMGTATKYEVRKRFLAKGYVTHDQENGWCRLTMFSCFLKRLQI